MVDFLWNNAELVAELALSVVGVGLATAVHALLTRRSGRIPKLNNLVIGQLAEHSTVRAAAAQGEFTTLPS